MKHYDVVVIGGGPGGYVAAEEAAKHHLAVALIENKFLGGTCLNTGCIPTKTLLRHAEVIELIEKAKKWGIEYENVTFSFEKMLKRKTRVVETLRKGVSSLLQNANVEIIAGTATVQPNRHIFIDTTHSQMTISADRIIIATGSSPAVPPISGLQQVSYHTTDTIFDIDSLPKSLVIIGGGVIGVEFACIFSALNVEVTIIEMANRLIPQEDKDASDLLRSELRKKRVKILTSAKVVEVSEDKGVKYIRIQTSNGEQITIEGDELLIASGRKPNLSAIQGLTITMNGPFIAVNQHLETSIPNMYAVGDCIGGWQLAHVASAEGIIAAKNAVGFEKEINYTSVPRCIYTSPEIASVGLTEQEARERGLRYRTQTFPLSASGKAMAMDERIGFIKIIVEETYGELLGVVMVGPHVTEMISQASSFIALEGTINELADLIFPHPTLSEGIWEAARAWLSKTPLTTQI